MASDSQNHREIARSLDINRQMARSWRNRWLETNGKDLSIIQRLQDMERVGAPVK
jgi:putative transposase